MGDISLCIQNDETVWVDPSRNISVETKHVIWDPEFDHTELYHPIAS